VPKTEDCGRLQWAFHRYLISFMPFARIYSGRQWSREEYIQVLIAVSMDWVQKNEGGENYLAKPHNDVEAALRAWFNREKKVEQALACNWLVGEIVESASPHMTYVEQIAFRPLVTLFCQCIAKKMQSELADYFRTASSFAFFSDTPLDALLPDHLRTAFEDNAPAKAPT
jgi:hypothetical protein